MRVLSDLESEPNSTNTFAGGGSLSAKAFSFLRSSGSLAGDSKVSPDVSPKKSPRSVTKTNHFKDVRTKKEKRTTRNKDFPLAPPRTAFQLSSKGDCDQWTEYVPGFRVIGGGNVNTGDKSGSRWYKAEVVEPKDLTTGWSEVEPSGNFEEDRKQRTERFACSVDQS